MANKPFIRATTKILKVVSVIAVMAVIAVAFTQFVMPSKTIDDTKQEQPNWNISSSERHY